MQWKGKRKVWAGTDRCPYLIWKPFEPYFCFSFLKDCESVYSPRSVVSRDTYMLTYGWDTAPFKRPSASLKGRKKKRKERKKIATKKCFLGVAISAFRLFRTFTTCYALWVFENGTSQGALPLVLLFIARLTVPSLSSIYPWLLSLCYLTLQHWSQPRSHGLLFSGRPRAVTLTVKTKAPKNG